MVPGANPIAVLARQIARAQSSAGLRTPSWPAIEKSLRKTPRRLIELGHDLLLHSPGAPDSLLLVLDQFEELLTRSSETERDAFLGLLRLALTEADSPIWVLATVRSEFLTPLLASGAMSRLSPQAVMIGPLDRGRLMEAIEGPARRARVIPDDGLASQMVADAAGSDALPLLAYALRQLYDHAEAGRRLTFSNYKLLGGVEGAVRAQADKVIDSLAARFDREKVIKTLLETVSLGPGFEPMRRRIERLALSSEANEIIDEFVSARLYRSDSESGQAVVEVAHEALLRVWPPLREAVDRAREGLKLRGELDAAAQDWAGAEQRESYFWSGDRLAAALKYQDSGAALSAQVQQFLSESARRDRATLKRQSELLANQALRECAADPELAILLSLAAIEQYAPVPRAALALSTAVSESRLRGRNTDETLLDAVLSPDGRFLAEVHSGEDYFLSNVIRVRELGTSSLLLDIDSFSGRVRVLGFSSNARSFVTSSDDGEAAVWDASTGKRSFATKPVPSAWSVGPKGEKNVTRWMEIGCAALSSDGGLVVLARADDRVEVWNTRTGKKLWSKKAVHATTLTFSSRDRQILAGNWAGELIRTRSPERRLKGRTRTPTRWSVSPRAGATR